MKLGIMQPYFFPYLGYFDLINSVDYLLIYDNVQYIKHGWINRNRILKPAGGWQYIAVPVDRSSLHASYRTSIENVEISQDQKWKTRIIGQLDHYRKKAPHFWETVALVECCLEAEESSIARLNLSILEKVCAVLGIEFAHSSSSEMKFHPDPTMNAQERILAICESLGARKYINLPGGRKLYDERSFMARGIEIEFRDLPALTYSCVGYEFIPNLSVLDLLMWNEPAKILEHLERHR